MRQHMERLVLLGVVALLALSCTGCIWLAAGAAGGAGTVAYMKGAYSDVLPMGLQGARKSVEGALAKLEFPIREQESSGQRAGYVAETAQGQRVRVALETILAERTRVAIRVGTFGDEALSRMIMEEIRLQAKTEGQ